MQVGVSPDDHCKVPFRIPALTAAQAEAFTRDIEHGYNVTMCALAPVVVPICWRAPALCRVGTPRCVSFLGTGSCSLQVTVVTGTPQESGRVSEGGQPFVGGQNRLVFPC